MQFRLKQIVQFCPKLRVSSFFLSCSIEATRQKSRSRMEAQISSPMSSSLKLASMQSMAAFLSQFA
jgi:hypothetical protein